MTTQCPICGKHVERKQVEAHVAAHDRADAIERTVLKVLRDRDEDREQERQDRAAEDAADNPRFW